MHGIQQYLVQRPQLVQNCTARLIFNKRKFKHVTPLLTGLQRFLIKQCNALQRTMQVIATTYTAINGSHLAILTTFLTYLSRCDRSLRSSNQLLMKVPSTNIVSFGGCAFSDAALKLCNSVSVYLFAKEKYTLLLLYCSYSLLKVFVRSLIFIKLYLVKRFFKAMHKSLYK